MSIHLNEEDRANLERLEKVRMKPTRRQKAIALLRLAAGLSPAEAADHAGIPKEEVEALATGFAESGLAGVGLGGKPKTRVRLVRPGVGVQKYGLPNGATLADLLRRSEATTTNQTVYVDGVMAEETVPLRDGAVVMIVPQPRKAAVDEPWRATIPSFQDDDLFEQYRAILKARRRDLGSDEGPEGVNILDTDALSHLQKIDPVGGVIAARLTASSDPDFRITTANAYEMLRGAFDLIHELRKKHKDLIPGFQLFQELFDYLRDWPGRILPYDDAADRVYRGFPPRLRQQLGNDARIAAIALAHGAAVWTCNVNDYKRVPGLIVYAAETGKRVA